MAATARCGPRALLVLVPATCFAPLPLPSSLLRRRGMLRLPELLVCQRLDVRQWLWPGERLEVDR